MYYPEIHSLTPQKSSPVLPYQLICCNLFICYVSLPLCVCLKQVSRRSSDGPGTLYVYQASFEPVTIVLFLSRITGAVGLSFAASVFLNT